MEAKEFFELNKGKYFMYDGKKVKLVGYRKDCPTKYLIITYSDGWTNEEDYNVIDPSLIDSESLVNGEWRFCYVIEKQLNSLEPKNIYLSEILKGCEGMVFYSTMVGYCRLIEITEYITIRYEDDDDCLVLESDGKYSIYGECTLFPSKENRDWSTFVNPNKIKEGTPVMTKWNSASFWKLESYSKDNKSDFIVPVSDFDFTDFDSNKSKSIV